MLVWGLFIAHKLIMLSIGVSALMYIFGKRNKYIELLLAGFLITQGILGFCVITVVENIARGHSGYRVSHNQFIAQELSDNGVATFIMRFVFVVVGILILNNIYGRRKP